MTQQTLVDVPVPVRDRPGVPHDVVTDNSRHALRGTTHFQANPGWGNAAPLALAAYLCASGVCLATYGRDVLPVGPVSKGAR